MIIDAIRRLYEHAAQSQVARGNPTGSRFGACAAQSQLLRYPEQAKPDAPRPRSLMTWEEGDRVEAWWSEQIDRAFPNASGLAQEPFYFAVPLDAADAARLQERIKYRSVWGIVEAGFVPPAITTPTDSGRARLRLLRRDPERPTRPARLGFVLDPEARVLWAPTYVDRVINHPLVGLTVLEKKSMSNYGFRRALLGDLGYGYRCQLAGALAATGLDAACWLLYRKETAHIAEILYTRTHATRVRVQIMRLNGQAEVYYVAGPEQVVREDGTPAELPGDAEWDQAETWTPHDPRLLDEIRARIRRVLLYTGDPTQLYREYGPTFVCPTCDGTRVQTRVKRGPALLKAPKPCPDCTDGQVAEAELPAYPCGYSVAPETPILLADHRWVPAAKIQVGDIVVGVDEHKAQRFRRVRHGVVSRVWSVQSPTLRLVTARGAVVCSPEHPWLVRLSDGQRTTEWREAGRITPGQSVAWLTAPRAVDIESEGYQGGYVRGLIDGEGAVRGRASGRPVVRVAMADLEALERLVWALQYFGLRTAPTPFRASAHRPMWQVQFGGKYHDPDGIAARLLAWPLHAPPAAAGYLAAIFDGEGSLEKRTGCANLRLHQTLGGHVAAAIEQAVGVLGLPMRLERWRKGRGVGAYRLMSDNLTAAIADFLCLTRPAVLRKATLVGKPLRRAWTPVLFVEPVAARAETVHLTVDGPHTFVAGGFVSHNCPVWRACWTPPGATAPIVRQHLDTRPHLVVRRVDWEASGLAFFPPEPAAPAPAPAERDAVATEQAAAAEPAAPGPSRAAGAGKDPVDSGEPSQEQGQPAAREAPPLQQRLLDW